MDTDVDETVITSDAFPIGSCTRDAGLDMEPQRTVMIRNLPVETAQDHRLQGSDSSWSHAATAVTLLLASSPTNIGSWWRAMATHRVWGNGAVAAESRRQRDLLPLPLPPKSTCRFVAYQGFGLALRWPH